MSSTVARGTGVVDGVVVVEVEVVVVVVVVAVENGIGDDVVVDDDENDSCCKSCAAAIMRSKLYPCLVEIEPKMVLLFRGTESVVPSC